MTRIDRARTRTETVSDHVEGAAAAVVEARGVNAARVVNVVSVVSGDLLEGALRRTANVPLPMIAMTTMTFVPMLTGIGTTTTDLMTTALTTPA